MGWDTPGGHEDGDGDNPWFDYDARKSYDPDSDSDNDSWNGNGHVSTSSITSPPYPPLSTPTAGYVDVVTILHAYDDGDLLIVIEGTTLRVCSADIPTALTSTKHLESNSHVQSMITPAAYTRSSLYPSGIPSTSSDWRKNLPTSSSSGTPPPSPSPSRTSGSVSKTGTAMPTKYSDSVSSPSQANPNPPPHRLPYGTIIAIPIVFFGVLILLVAAWRIRKRRRLNRTGVTQEMKMRSPEDGLPQYSAANPMIPAPLIVPRDGPSASTSSLSAATLRQQSPSNTHAQATLSNDPNEPIILTSNINGAYLTGIDTSDAMSVTSGQRHHQNRMSIDERSMLSSDDPPPPYRPRSVPPISRETSVRIPSGSSRPLSGLGPVLENSMSRVPTGDDSDDDDPRAGLRNPFADPDPDSSDDEEDDFASVSSATAATSGRGGGGSGEGGISRFGNSNPGLPSRNV